MRPEFKDLFALGRPADRSFRSRVLRGLGRLGKVLGAFGLLATVVDTEASAHDIACRLKDFVHDRATGQDDWAYVNALTIRHELNQQGSFAGDVAMRSMYGWK
jgi:hypothetical protein